MVEKGKALVTEAKTVILENIRRALGQRPSSEYADIARAYRASGTLDSEQRIEKLTEKLHDYGASVHRCAEAELPQTIEQARGGRRMIAPGDIPATWFVDGSQWIRDSGLSYVDMDRSGGVLTGCTLAIAETGTIVLCHSTGEGRRALSLIPDYHLCVVRPAQIVETVIEAMRMLAPARLITMISGPSATADIEMTRVKGVHGPRTLEVILVTKNA